MPAHQIADDEIDQRYGGNQTNGNLYVFAIFQNFVVELFFGHDIVKVPAQKSQNSVPCTGANGGIEQEFRLVHLGQSGGNGDQVPNARNEAPRDGGHHTMVVKIFLALLYFALVEQAEVSQPAVGKLVDDGAPQIVACQIVDGSPGHGA